MILSLFASYPKQRRFDSPHVLPLGLRETFIAVLISASTAIKVKMQEIRKSPA